MHLIPEPMGMAVMLWFVVHQQMHVLNLVMATDDTIA